ncbi:MAG: SDR family NAD(P)-dependent oxidoreductase, partial [Henriciella sp.]
MSAQNQKKIQSGFGAKSTAAEVVSGIDLTGRHAIVTGGYSGIGLETVRALAGAGASVTVPARRVDVAERALADIAGDISVRSMDLGDLKSVRAFADEYVSSGRPLDILINN